MSTLVEFLAPADAEYREAVDWYAARSARTAERFCARVSRAVQAAAARPTSAGFLIGRRVRKIPLRPYDYGLLYFFFEHVLYIVAVAHNKRRPRYWQHRLSQI